MKNYRAPRVNEAKPLTKEDLDEEVLDLHFGKGPAYPDPRVRATVEALDAARARVAILEAALREVVEAQTMQLSVERGERFNRARAALSSAPSGGRYLTAEEVEKVRDAIEDPLTSGMAIVGDGRLADDTRRNLYEALALLGEPTK